VTSDHLRVAVFIGIVGAEEVRAVSAMIFEVYDALKDAGATEEKAKKAAEALAAYENRFNKVESDLNLLKWMVGFNLALSAGILLKSFGA